MCDQHSYLIKTLKNPQTHFHICNQHDSKEMSHFKSVLLQSCPQICDLKDEREKWNKATETPVQHLSISKSSSAEQEANCFPSAAASVKDATTYVGATKFMTIES